MRFTDGFLRETPSGKWAGVVKYRDPAGQWRQLTKTLSADRAEAEAAFAAWRAQMAEGGGGPAAPAPRAPGSPTVEEAVRACLAAQLARGRIERSTHDMQLALAEREVFPELGALPLAALGPAEAQAWLDRACLRLAPGTVRLALSVLRKALRASAARWGLAGDPLAGVEAPARARPARAWLPDAEAARLEAACAREWGAGSARACAVALALRAGLRAGECCALRWRDADLVGRRVRVAASVGRSASGPYLKAPKCAASAREFPVVAALAAALEARAREAAREAGASAPPPAWFVCGGESFADPRALSSAVARLCAREGVADSGGRRATFHALRRTFATRAVRAGVDVRTLADLMGHARADVTLNVYAGSGEDAKLAAVARMEGAGT